MTKRRACLLASWAFFYELSVKLPRLRRRCLPVPEDVERPDEYALAGNLVKRKFSYRADEARKAARFLQYRGFSPSVIRDVLEDFTVH